MTRRLVFAMFAVVLGVLAIALAVAVRTSASTIDQRPSTATARPAASITVESGAVAPSVPVSGILASNVTTVSAATAAGATVTASQVDSEVETVVGWIEAAPPANQPAASLSLPEVLAHVDVADLQVTVSGDTSPAVSGVAGVGPQVAVRVTVP